MDDLLQAEVNSKFYLTGGTFPGTVFLTDDSEMHIYGYGFAYNPNGQISTVKGGTLQVGILNGFWGNDTPFEINFLDRFSENSYDHVYLHQIPEPATLLIFILGAAAMRKKH